MRQEFFYTRPDQRSSFFSHLLQKNIVHLKSGRRTHQRMPRPPRMRQGPLARRAAEPRLRTGFRPLADADGQRPCHEDATLHHLTGKALCRKGLKGRPPPSGSLRDTSRRPAAALLQALGAGLGGRVRHWPACVTCSPNRAGRSVFHRGTDRSRDAA